MCRFTRRREDKRAPMHPPHRSKTLHYLNSKSSRSPLIKREHYLLLLLLFLIILISADELERLVTFFQHRPNDATHTCIIRYYIMNRKPRMCAMKNRRLRDPTVVDCFFFSVRITHRFLHSRRFEPCLFI